MSEDEIVPGPEGRPAASATWTRTTSSPGACGPSRSGASPARSTAALAGHSDAYRRLDAAALEELFLKGALGLSDEDIAAKRGIGYTPSAAEAIASCAAGEYDAAFFLRPTPVEQVREVAAAGRDDAPEVDLLLPQAAHRARLQPAELSAPGREERSVWSPRDQDLHAQGRRRHAPRSGTAGGSRRTTRAPRPTARSTRRAPRSGSPARSAAQNHVEPRQRHPPLQQELFVAGAELATAPEAGRAARGRRQPDHGGHGRRARGGHRPLHGPGRPAAAVRDPRRHPAFGAARRRADGDPPRRAAGGRP